MQSRPFTEFVLLDANFDKADGEAKDIAHGIPFSGQMKIYAGTYDDVADAAIIIVTAGANQKPEETRLDLVNKNVAVYKSIIPEIAQREFQGILLVVSNPVDILTYAAVKIGGFPEQRVLGSGIEAHVPVSLDEEEMELLKHSADTLKEVIGSLDLP